MKKPLKNYAFIDSQNLNLAIQKAGWKLDFKKFYIYLKDKYGVKKAFLFIGHVPGNEELYENLKDMGYTLVFKPTLENAGIIKGNCDAELVLHCMIEYSHFNKAVIVSGDGDFHCLIKHLKKNKKLLKIGIPNKNRYSALLREFADNFFFVSKLRKNLEYKNERHLNKDKTLNVASHRDGQIVIKKIRKVKKKVSIKK